MGMAMCTEKSKGSGVSMKNIPKGLQVHYFEGFNRKKSYSVEKAKKVCFYPDFVSHPNVAPNEAGKVGPGAEGMANVVLGFTQNIPDIKWTVQEVLHIKMPHGDKYVCLSTTEGVPIGDGFAGIPGNGNGFNWMACDIHWIVDGKVKHTWHIEELASCIQQLTSKDAKKGVPLFHNGQAGNFGMYMQTTPGKQITKDDLPECVKLFYAGLSHEEQFADEEKASEIVKEKICAENWQSHPNAIAPGKAGPGAAAVGGMLANFWKQIPDMKWETLMAFQIPCSDKFEKFLHISKVTGTTDGKFLEVELETPKPFCIWAFDIHVVKNGLIQESWHIEDWLGAVQQLKAEGDAVPELHNGQPLDADAGMTAPPKEEKKDEKKEEGKEEKKEEAPADEEKKEEAPAEEEKKEEAPAEEEKKEEAPAEEEKKEEA